MTAVFIDKIERFRTSSPSSWKSNVPIGGIFV